MKAFKSPLAVLLPLTSVLIVDAQSQDPGLYVRFFALSILLAAFAVFERKHINFNHLFNPLAAVVLVFSVWPILLAPSAPAPSEIYLHLSRMLFLYGTTVLFSSQFQKDPAAFKSALGLGAQLALLVAALTVLPALAEAYRVDDIYKANGALFTHKNFAAATLLLWTPLAFLQRETSTPYKALLWTSVSLSALTMLLLRTRGVWLGGMAILLTATLLNIFKDGFSWKKPSGKSLIGVLVAIATATAIGLTKGAGQVFNSATIQNRFHYWKAAWKMFQEHPIAGVGAGHWKIYFPAYGLKGTDQSVMEGVTNIIRPHNDFLWVLSETGAIGALLFIAILSLSIWMLTKHRQEAFLFTVIGFVVYGLAEFPLERATTLLPFGIAMGVAGAQFENRAWGKLKTWALPVLLMPLLFSSYGSYTRWKSEQEAEQTVQQYLKRTNFRALGQHAAAAQSPFLELDIYATPMPYFEALSLLGTLSAERPDPTIFERAEKILKEAIALHPNHMTSLNQLGDIYKFQKKYALAEAQYKRVVEMSPRHYVATINLVEIYLAQNDLKQALAYLNKVSPKVNIEQYQKLAQVGSSVLVAYRNSPEEFVKFPGLQARLKRVNSRPQMWKVWMDWRREKRSTP